MFYWYKSLIYIKYSFQISLDISYALEICIVKPQISGSWLQLQLILGRCITSANVIERSLYAPTFWNISFLPDTKLIYDAWFQAHWKQRYQVLKEESFNCRCAREVIVRESALGFNGIDCGRYTVAECSLWRQALGIEDVLSADYTVGVLFVMCWTQGSIVVRTSWLSC